MAYQAAMMAEQERLAKAQKRNFEIASGSVGGSDDERDTKEEAWASVFASTSAAGAESAEEQRRRKLQRKTERRKEKAAAAEANVANFTAYVTGIPKEVVWTAVQTLFSKAGEVRRVKLYKDAAGEPKGDGLVTFATDAGLQAALSRDWALFGDTLTVSAAHLEERDAVACRCSPRCTPSSPQVSAAHFEARGAVPKEDWARVVVLTNLFSIEELGSCGEVRMIDDNCIGVTMIAMECL